MTNMNMKKKMKMKMKESKSKSERKSKSKSKSESKIKSQRKSKSESERKSKSKKDKLQARVIFNKKMKMIRTILTLKISILLKMTSLKAVYLKNKRKQILMRFLMK